MTIQPTTVFRTTDYKLIFVYGLPLDATGTLPIETPPGWELYDLRIDPNENRNLYFDPSYREIRESLQQRLASMKEEFGDTDETYPELLERLRQPVETLT